MTAVASVLMITAGISWSTTYILIIRQGFRDRTYGMPIAALCANISWEFIFSFVLPQMWRQRVIDIAWLGLDVIIWSQALRFGPKEFPHMPKRVFYAMFGFTQAVAFGTVLAITHEFKDWNGYYAAYGQSLMMSALFLVMLYSRRSLRGQSMGIAVTKMIGTALVSIAFTVHPLEHAHSVLLPFLYVACTILDVAYVGAVYMVGRAASAQARELAAPAPASAPAWPATTDRSAPATTDRPAPATPGRGNLGSYRHVR